MQAKDIPQEIVVAYNTWMQKIVEVPEHSYELNYKKAKRAEKYAGDKFEKLCDKFNLGYMQVCGILSDNTKNIS